MHIFVKSQFINLVFTEKTNYDISDKCSKYFFISSF